MHIQHIAFAICIALVWGFTFIAAKAGVTAFPPLWFTGLRFVLVALLLSFYIRPLGARLRPVLLVAATAGVIHYGLFYLGIRLAGQVSAIAITVQLVSPFSLLLAALMLQEHIGWRRILGMALAFAGVVVLGFDPVIFRHIDGLGLVMLAAMSMSLALILMRRLRNVGVLELQAWIALVSAPPILLLSLLLERGQMAAMLGADWIGIGAVAFTAVGASILGQGGWYYLLQRYPVSQVTPFGLLAPVTGVLFAVLIYDEALSLRFLAGGSLTMIGVAIITLRSRNVPPVAATGEHRHS